MADCPLFNAEDCRGKIVRARPRAAGAVPTLGAEERRGM
jgi:hypothetical protein